jgi:hypothetical protein
MTGKTALTISALMLLSVSILASLINNSFSFKDGIALGVIVLESFSLLKGK